MRRSRNILSAAGDALLRTLLLYGNGTDDLLPDDMPIHRSALRTRFFEQSNMPDARSVEVVRDDKQFTFALGRASSASACSLQTLQSEMRRSISSVKRPPERAIRRAISRSLCFRSHAERKLRMRRKIGVFLTELSSAGRCLPATPLNGRRASIWTHEMLYGRIEVSASPYAAGN
jgi:hypothetical protein